jgi:small subunit ribosomal protein S6
MSTPTTRKYNYEAMFLIGQNQTGDLAGILAHIEEIMQRGHATIIAMKKWDERRLAYEIGGQKRGLYILCYFNAPGGSLSHIERDCNLSERLLRALIQRCDHLTVDEMKATDARADLAVEAKLRAERAAQIAAGQPVDTKEPAEAAAEA